MSNKINRRQMLKLTGGVAAGALMYRFGGRPTFAQDGLPFTVAPGAENPFGIGPADVDGLFFEGGFGSDYIKNAANWMADLHDGVKVKVTTTQQVTESLMPRLISGDAPDVVDGSGGDTGALISENQLLDLTPLFEAPALDTPDKTFGDTLLVGSQKAAYVNGKPYFVNLSYGVYGVCYSGKFFDARGYTIPQTWDEFATLCDTIKKDDGIAPWTYQGIYPGYLWDEILLPLIYRAGGNEALKNIDNLEPDAWKTPEVLRAVEALYMIYDRGWLLKGTVGLDHTQSQTEFYKGSAAFIPCGTWLEAEMATILPPDFVTLVANVPGFADKPEYLNGVGTFAGESYYVPVGAKNPNHGMEFIRIILSVASAKQFAGAGLGTMSVAGGTDGVEMSPFLNRGVELAQVASEAIDVRFSQWYKPLGDALDSGITGLMSGDLNPQGFVDQIQKAADDVAKDPDIAKFTR